MLCIVTVDDGLVADAAHERHKDFQVTICARNVIIKARLQERVEALSPHSRFTFAVQDAEEVELIDPEGELIILLEALLLSIVVLLVFEDHKDIILHQKSPI